MTEPNAFLGDHEKDMQDPAYRAAYAVEVARLKTSPHVEWRRFDYENKAETAPKGSDLVWIVEDYYSSGVDIGYFDGFTFRTSAGSDDCSVSWWAPITYPEPPEEWPAEWPGNPE